MSFLGSVYTCQVSAVTGDDLNPNNLYDTIEGRSTLLNVTTYSK